MSGWLSLIDDEGDRRLVVAAVMYQAHTGRRVDWMAMREVAGVRYGADGVRMRYKRILTALGRKLGQLSRAAA